MRLQAFIIQSFLFHQRARWQIEARRVRHQKTVNTDVFSVEFPEHKRTGHVQRRRSARQTLRQQRVFIHIGPIVHSVQPRRVYFPESQRKGLPTRRHEHGV